MGKLSFIKSIGNFISNILLGNTKEIIIRTDEQVKTLLETITQKIEPDLKNVRERFAVAEKVISNIASKIPEYYPELILQLKDGAFKTGSDLDTLLYVGGIHLRNLIFADLGFQLDAIDGVNATIDK